MNEAVEIESVVGLSPVGPHLTETVWPDGPFDPLGAWSHSYRICNLAGGDRGSVRIARTPSDGGGATLEIEATKLLFTFLDGKPLNLKNPLNARIRCNSDALSTPIEWEFDTHTLLLDGKRAPELSVHQSGRTVSGGVRLKTGDSEAALRLPAPFTLQWSLFDAIQRLKRPLDRQVRFTMLRDFDQPKPEQVLAWRGSTKARLQNGVVLELDSFEQVGQGVLPIAYWLNKSGRLLFVISGLEAYIMEAKAQ